MLRRLLLIAIAGCGGAGSAPAAPSTAANSPVAAAAPAPAGAAARSPAAPAAPDTAAPAVPTAGGAPAAAAPAAKPPLHERLRDRDGKVAGLAGFSVTRKPDAKHCGGIAIVTKRGTRVATADAPLADVYKLQFPTGLDFDPDPANAKRKEASLAKFNAFIAELTKVGGTATRHYQAQLSAADPAVKLAAMARIAQLNFRLASLFGRAEIPRDVRSGEFAKDKIAAFCDTLSEQAELLQERGEEAARRCGELAKQAGAAGWWDEVCVAK